MGQIDGSKPLRVLMVMTSMDRGGMETFTMNVYRAINRDEIQFDFLLHRDFCGAYEEEIQRLGGRIYRIRRQNPLDPRYWAALDKFFTEHLYHVVHVQLDCLSAIPLIVAKRHGIELRIAHSHSSKQDYDFKYPIKLFTRHFIKTYATHLLACGEDAGKWMFCTNSFEIVPNAIDVDCYEYDPVTRTSLRKEFGIADDSIVIGHVGRFVSVKNHVRILSIFNKIHEENPTAKLILVGEGELREKVEKYAEELNLGDSVSLLGVRSDVSSLLQVFDVFLMPSLYEGLPMVLVEAQAAGLPCVISDTIPSDCDFDGGLIIRESLEREDEVWVEDLIEAAGISYDRSQGSQVVKDAGFDIASLAERLKSLYLDGE